MVVDLITANLTVHNKTIRDISVGQHWDAYWEDSRFADKYGERIRFLHDYPPYYPQSQSNPQWPWAYPDTSLPEFRRWFRHEYLLTKFPRYILTKAGLLAGGRDEAAAIANLYRPTEIEGPKG